LTLPLVTVRLTPLIQSAESLPILQQCLSITSLDEDVWLRCSWSPPPDESSTGRRDACALRIAGGEFHKSYFSLSSRHNSIPRGLWRNGSLPLAWEGLSALGDAVERETLRNIPSPWDLHLQLHPITKRILIHRAGSPYRIRRHCHSWILGRAFTPDTSSNGIDATFQPTWDRGRYFEAGIGRDIIGRENCEELV